MQDSAERVLYAIEQMLCDHTEEEVDKKRATGEFEFQALAPSLFCKLFNEVTNLYNVGLLKNPPTSFVDVGCGIGTKLIMAFETPICHSGIRRADGIECYSKYADVAERLLNSFRGSYNRQRNKLQGSIIRKDAREVDYSEWDLIYFYCPMINYEMQKELERQIVNTMKKGAILLPAAEKSDLRSNTQLKTFGTTRIYQKR